MSASGENRLPLASRLYIGQSLSPVVVTGRCAATTAPTTIMEQVVMSRSLIAGAV
jgi:hypothetical protein